MNADIMGNLVTLVVGLSGAVVAYFGTIKGAKIQIESAQEKANEQLINEMKELHRTRKQQEKFTRKAIENFLSIEIKKNFTIFQHYSTYLEFAELLNNNETPFQYGIFGTFTYQEYNNLKYELIKSESNEVKEIISIYEMFYLMERKKDIHLFTQTEYDEFKKAYNICLVKYS